MLRYEFNKMLKNNRGALIIPVILLLIFAISILTSAPSNQGLEVNKSEYQKIISEYELSGRVTDKSKASLDSLAEKCEKAEADFDRLIYKYQLGEISRGEYRKRAIKLSEITNLKFVIKIFQMQFDYAKDSPDNRFIMYTNGWELATNRSFDIAFIALALLVVTLGFKGDTDGGMKAFLLTCKSGKVKLPIIKLFVSEAVVSVSYILHTLIYYAFIAKKYGLPNGDYPVQSLQSFSEYSRACTLIEANFRITLIRLFALMVCTAFIFMCFAITDSSVGAIGVSSAFIMLPIIAGLNISQLPEALYLYALLFAVMIALSIIFWKRKSNSK